MAQETRQPRELAIRAALLAIVLMAAAFRFFNVNWDKGTYHIHPDERNTAMVAADIQLPASVGEYFDTSRSPLNPDNHDKVFFYGTLPLFLDKWLAVRLGMDSYDQIHLVGRVLSGLFDLASVLLIFFMARRLFDWRVGLVAAFLLALAVLNIQGSHYFASDTFLTFFVTLTLWFTLDLAAGKGWPAFLATGLSMGLTMACKVSVFVLALIVVLGAWLGTRRYTRQGGEPGRATTRAVLGLILAGLTALAVFRVAQPYAWAGPNYNGWDTIPEPWGKRVALFQKVPEPIRAVIMPNPQWIADLASAGEQQTGKADMPWGRQWTERTRWVFPMENMMLWGLGVPLGAAAWAGVGLAAVQLVRARRRGTLNAGGEERAGPDWELIAVPLAWVVLLFLWQGAQFVKSVRYFLPIYPCLAMFGAYLLIAAWDWARARGRAWRVAAGALAGVVLVGTAAWALAFMEIYREPVTRVQATRWMYEHVETAATLRYRTADGQPGELQINMPASHVYSLDGEGLSTPFSAPFDLVATEVVMNNLAGEHGPSQGAFLARILPEDAAAAPLAEARVEATFGPLSRRHVLDLPDVPLAAGQAYYLYTGVLAGAPLVSQGSAIANEHFDDPLPFNLDGRTAFAPLGPYRSLSVSYPGRAETIDQLQLYDDDRPEKLAMLLDALDQADYIVMSSGRLYQSIPRLPMRYPMTTRYYELLFAEKLGFEKAAEFHSYPRLLGIEFNDTSAEEQFTVYDHPRVLIYRKTAAYNREEVRDLLSEGIDWSKVAHALNPRDVPAWKRANENPRDLMLTPAEREVQEQGGTWASLFDRRSLANRWPTASWYVMAALLGLAALPLTVAVLGRLPDRGYILARPVGVLLLAWLSWIITNLTPLHYSRGTIMLALGLIAVTSAATLVSARQRQRLAEMWRTQRRLIAATEGLFLLFFAAFWLIRWANPDLWHPWMGGEKPMDFAYLNAVIKSSEFPPYDPWFAGGYLNYYYFGQVMVGTLIKLIGIVPPVAYNLVLPLWFAMTAMGAFSVTYNLVAGASGRARPDGAARPFAFGAVGALFAVVLGNLGQVALILTKVGEGAISTFRSTIPGIAFTVRAIIGAFEVIFGARALPIAINEWYWNASRAIPTPAGESVITEFPFFTFLYADLHAHLIALPLTFLSLAAAVAVVMSVREHAGQAAGGGAEQALPAPDGRGLRGDSRAWPAARGAGWRGLAGRLALIGFWGLVIGAMRTTNTWDVPPHLLVAMGALGIGEILQPDRPGWRRLASAGWQLALLFVLAWSVLYQPFWAHYGSFYTSVGLWNGARTPLWAYLVVHGLFLFAIVSYLVARSVERGDGRRPDPFLRRAWLSVRHWRRSRRLRRAAGLVGIDDLPVGPAVWVLLGLAIVFEVFVLWPGRVDPQLQLESKFAYTGLAVFGLGLPIALLGLLLVTRPAAPATERLWAYLVLLGLAMSLGVEVIVLKGDIGRMNTVFKFYLQVWLMWAVAAAAALAWLVPRVRRWRWGQTVWIVALMLLVAAAALYPPTATSAKIRDRFNPEIGPGLDGWAYMTTARYGDPLGGDYELKWDLEAIRWLLDNVVGSPTILEGHAPEYRWGARYAINTGLPTVLGWNWHQRQQRAAADEQVVWRRVEDIDTMYNTIDRTRTMELLEQYGVRYVIVGPMERIYYGAPGLDKFGQMADDGQLDVVFRNEGVTIYQVVR